MSKVMDEHYAVVGGSVSHPSSLADEIKLTNLRTGSWKKCDCERAPAVLVPAKDET